jgi:DMSO/TMAO reductase YedYZ molybdopterin-dependent catalytic subunit
MSILSRLKVPAFKAGGVPGIDEESYRLEVFGLVDPSLFLSLNEIRQMPMSGIDARLASVSGWSVRALWQGVLWRDFIKSVNFKLSATHVTFYSIGDTYRTTISLEDLDHPRVVLVYSVDSEPLEKLYGGPLRMVIPQLYGYKSAKWLGKIEFCDSMRGGYWEDKGYTRSGKIEPGFTLDLNTNERRPIKGGEILDF